MDASSIIELLSLIPHPEGGHYGETWREPALDGERSFVTAIYFVLRKGERSHWHKVDATEIWLWHGGAPLRLEITAGVGRTEHVLGCDLVAGERPQAVVPPRAWQSAASLGDWTLVSCVVAPGFEFSGFELAAPGWEP